MMKRNGLLTTVLMIVLTAVLVPVAARAQDIDLFAPGRDANGKPTNRKRRADSKMCADCARQRKYRHGWSAHALATRDGTDCGICGEPVDMDLRWPEPDEDWNPRDERERLAADMSLEALQTSYDDTEETVTKAIDSGLEVSEDAVLIRMADKSKDEREAAVEQIESKRAVLLEDMAETLAHKQELLEEKKKSEA